MEGLKKCTKCEQWLSVSLFYADRQKKDGLKPSCKTCNLSLRPSQIESSKRWKARNKQKVTEYKRNYYNTHLKRPRPPKDLTAPKRAKIAWKKRNPVKVYADRASRRAKELLATPSWAREESIRHYYTLASFMSESTGIKWHVDHIVPLRGKSVCGLHVEHNLTFLPASFNIAKSNKFDDWADIRPA